MNDRELLELAAKAAGIRGESTDYGFKQDAGGTEENPEWYVWDPLTDDGDALRLAVKLGIQIQIVGTMDDEVMAYALTHEEVEPWEKLGNDPYAATRRAIVRAAAEIGKENK